MTDFDNTNTGALFKNDKKTSEKAPDYKGTINVDGVDYWLSSWLKTSKQGDKYMSLSVQPKEAPAKAPTRAPAPRQAPSHDSARARQLPPQDEFDESIPF
jgi:uncharacterized protein (DUF736 family)